MDHLVAEAEFTLQVIRQLGSEMSSDPWADPAILEKSIRLGVLDAPHLKNNPFALGQINTRILNGSCVATDPQGVPLSEAARLGKLLR